MPNMIRKTFPVPPLGCNCSIIGDPVTKQAIVGDSGVALHTPGHTPGSMCFSFHDEKLLFAGDTLFRGGIGRTDLWGGDGDAIERSIRDRLYTMDEETVVVTGHGPETQIGFEQEYNPFI